MKTSAEFPGRRIFMEKIIHLGNEEIACSLGRKLTQVVFDVRNLSGLAMPQPQACGI